MYKYVISNQMIEAKLSGKYLKGANAAIVGGCYYDENENDAELQRALTRNSSAPSDYLDSTWNVF
jgi:hypothetical protein